MSSYQVRARSGTPIADDFDSDIPPLVEDFDTGRTFSVTEAGVITLIGPMNQGEIGFILYPRTAAEIASGVTPTNYAYAPGWVPRYVNNTVPGTTDCTTGIQAALDQMAQGGAPAYAPANTYLTGTVNIANGIKAAFSGDGIGRIYFKINASNTNFLQKANSAGSADGARIGGFTIIPHASASTGPAIKCTGFRNSNFYDIEGTENGTSGFFSLFDLASTPYGCYQNTFCRPRLNNCRGYTKMFDFNSGGTNNPTFNANDHTIYDPWAVDNTGLGMILDMRASAEVKVFGGLFENNSGTLACNMGNSTTILGVWFETNGTDFDFNTAADGTGNDCKIMFNYLSTAHNIDFHSAGHGNVFMWNTEVGTQTFVGTTAGSNLHIKMDSGLVGDPTAPTITYNSGEGSGANLSGATPTVTKNIDQLSRIYVVSLKYSWTAPTGANPTKFTVSNPTGYTLISLSVGMFEGATGIPGIASTNNDGTFWIKNVNTNAQRIVAYASYIKT